MQHQEKGLRAFFLARCNASRARDSSAAGEPEPLALTSSYYWSLIMNKTLSAAALILSLGSALAFLPAVQAADDMKMSKEASMDKDMKMDKKMADDKMMDMSKDKKMEKDDKMMKKEMNDDKM
jgi:hypothetical protein